jgi:dimethylargininase
MPAITPMTFTQAICRKPNTNLGSGVTTAQLGSPDIDLAMSQYDAYVKTLIGLGLKMLNLDAEPDYPDAHFIEDSAVVTPHVAVIARPGHLSRRGEELSVVPHLEDILPIAMIEAPGTLDGGDVLLVGNHAFIGISERTNEAGAEQLSAILAKHAFTSTMIPVSAGLHFKSSVNEIGESLLVTEDFAQRPELANYNCIVVPRGEEYAGNTLRINDNLITPAGFPGVLAKLKPLGMKITELEMSEFQKMDGGLSCLSLRLS